MLRLYQNHCSRKCLNFAICVCVLDTTYWHSLQQNSLKHWSNQLFKAYVQSLLLSILFIWILSIVYTLFDRLCKFVLLESLKNLQRLNKLAWQLNLFMGWGERKYVVSLYNLLFWGRRFLFRSLINYFTKNLSFLLLTFDELNTSTSCNWINLISAYLFPTWTK